MAVFTPRTTKPEAGNKYYITKAKGGYSDAIQGKPTDPNCDVLANCVGYAYGRFNEIGGYGYCKYLRPVNAENFIQYAGGLGVGQTPKLGACMVWRKGATLSNSDGAGHVAIVEKVVSNTQVVTSESGYGSSTPFWTKTRNKGDGNWGAGAGYTFLGFIYNPAPCCSSSGTSSSSSGTSTPSTPTAAAGSYTLEQFIRDVQKACGAGVDGIAGPKTLAATVTISKSKNRRHAAVLPIQKRLKALGYTQVGSLDGVAGNKFDEALKAYQLDHNCVVDGEATKACETWQKLLGMIK
ncbi:MAG: peptidoglycan-binding protein [Faecousia sp.]